MRFLEERVAHDPATNGRGPRVLDWAQCGKWESEAGRQEAGRQATRQKQIAEKLELRKKGQQEAPPSGLELRHCQTACLLPGSGSSRVQTDLHCRVPNTREATLFQYLHFLIIPSLERLIALTAAKAQQGVQKGKQQDGAFIAPSRHPSQQLSTQPSRGRLTDCSDWRRAWRRGSRWLDSSLFFSCQSRPPSGARDCRNRAAI